jgi:segregation and condensation protein B
MELSNQIEGLLFYKASPLKKSYLAKTLGVDDAALAEALRTLGERLMGSALRLVETEAEVQLVTAPELDSLIESVRKDEMRRDIGKAGAETLAIILYKGPISRAEIDRIRGVNSSFILRNLMVRGLIERETEKNISRFFATPALLAHLGIGNVTQLPQYAQVLDQIEKFEAQQKEEDTTTYE